MIQNVLIVIHYIFDDLHHIWCIQNIDRNSQKNKANSYVNSANNIQFFLLHFNKSDWGVLLWHGSCLYNAVVSSPSADE